MNGILSVPLPRWEGLGEGENGKAFSPPPLSSPIKGEEIVFTEKIRIYFIMNNRRSGLDMVYIKYSVPTGQCTCALARQLIFDIRHENIVERHVLRRKRK
jgi:hypothetical protein